MTVQLHSSAHMPSAAESPLPNLPGAADDITRPMPPKIVFFYQDFGAMGGIERWLLETARQLKARGAFEPVVVCNAGTPLHARLQEAGLTVHGVPARSFFQRSFLRSFDFQTLRALRCILDQERPVLVHVHIGLLENRWIQHWGYPVVYSVHGYGTLYSVQAVDGFLKKGVKRLMAWAFRCMAVHLDALLFVSEAERERMYREGFIGSMQASEVLHNGVALAEWQTRLAAVDRAAVRQQFGIPPQTRCISFVNRLDANKNPLLFIEVARRLSGDQNADYHFLLAGDGPLFASVQQAAADLPNVHVLGHVEAVPEVLAISDLVIHPARHEGFGLGLVEAMAAGVPCLALPSGGAREILQGEALAGCLLGAQLVDGVSNDKLPASMQNPAHVLSSGLASDGAVAEEPELPAALTAAALRLLNLPESEQAALRQALQDRAAEFDSARFLEKLEATYRRLCPKVSVILPVYQGEETIVRAVHTVLAQTYPYLELIVVDDGSTDQTLARLAQLQDPRLKILAQQNAGVAVARNTAALQASGDYIAFIDADDVWLPQKLAVEIAVLRRMAAGLSPECLIYSSYIAVDDRDRVINLPPIRQAAGDLSEQVLADEGLFLPSTTLVHRAVFEALGGFKADCYHEDRVFFIEACRQFPAYPTGQRLVLYRQSLSGRCRRVLRDFDEALVAELSIVETLRHCLPATELDALTLRQQANLLCRFLMYNYPAHARRLYQQLQVEISGSSGMVSGPKSAEALFTGKKGMLVRFSLSSGVNFLWLVRLIMQSMYRVLSPFLRPVRPLKPDGGMTPAQSPLGAVTSAEISMIEVSLTQPSPKLSPSVSNALIQEGVPG